MKGELEKLRAFALWCLREGPWQACDLGGGDIQDKAVELGLLREVRYDPKVHGENRIDAITGEPWFEAAFGTEGEK